jgi:hypothetical protein
MRLAQAIIPRPPPIPNTTLTHSVRMRFSTSAQVGLSISWKNLLDTWIVATSSTQGYQLFDTVRIRAIEIWAYSPAGPVTCTVTFPGAVLGAVGDSSTHTDTCMGLEPAHVLARPGRKSAAALYQGSTTSTAFDIYTPTGAVVDVLLSFRSSMAGYAPVAATNALVAAQTGNIYARGMDGLPAATSKFVVQGIPDYV